MRGERGTIEVCCAFALGSLGLAVTAIQDWYVDTDADCAAATGGFEFPFCTVTEAVAAAADGDTIHLRPGTYVENVVLDKDLALIGTGGEEVTILDGGGSGSVVLVDNGSGGTLSQIVTLTGLTLTNGTGTPRGVYGATGGGGLLAEPETLVTLIDSTVIANTAATYVNCSRFGCATASGGGGGVYSSGALYVLGSTVRGNSVTGQYYGGAEQDGGSGVRAIGPLTIVDSRVHDNGTPDLGGGALAIYSEEAATLVDSAVDENLHGGILAHGELTLTNSSVSRNGGFLFYYPSYNPNPYYTDGPGIVGEDVTLQGCVVNENDAGFSQGSPWPLAGSPYALLASRELVLTDCEIRDNTGRGGISFRTLGEEGEASLTRTVVSGNQGSWFGGIKTYGPLTMTDCVVSDNTGLWEAGGIHSFASELVLANCTVTGNASTGGREFQNAGGVNVAYGDLTLIDTVVRDNDSQLGPGGLGVFFSQATLTNSTVTGNTTGEPKGGGIAMRSYYYSYGPYLYSYSCSLTLNNSTVSGNTTSLGDDTLELYAEGSAPCSLVAVNSILHGGASLLQLEGADASATIDHSLVEGGWPGTGNFDADPLFVDPASGDYRLLPTSPCIDAGDNTAVPLGITFDLRGAPRFLDDPRTPDTGIGPAPVVDLGAYEFFRRTRDARGFPLRPTTR